MTLANRPLPRALPQSGLAPARQDPALIEAASRAARRFQLAAQLHLSRSNARALQRDGEALFDLLWRMGFRPGRDGDPQGGLLPLSRSLG